MKHPTAWEAWMLLLLVGAVVLIFWVSAEVKDLRCRVARMETLAVSADPLPDCDDVPARTPRPVEGDGE